MLLTSVGKLPTASEYGSAEIVVNAHPCKPTEMNDLQQKQEEK